MVVHRMTQQIENNGVGGVLTPKSGLPNLYKYPLHDASANHSCQIGNMQILQFLGIEFGLRRSSSDEYMAICTPHHLIIDETRFHALVQHQNQCWKCPLTIFGPQFSYLRHAPFDHVLFPIHSPSPSPGFWDMLSFGTTCHAVAPPCLSTRTRSDRHFPGLAGACARGGGGYLHL